MKLYLQQGSGMLRLNEEIAIEEPDIGFILSPRALNKNTKIHRIKEHSTFLISKGREVLFDPQFYEPRTNLSKILRFPYFEDNKDEYLTQEFSGEKAQIFSKNSIRYQEIELNVSSYIIPGIYTNNINENWLELFEDMLNGAFQSGFNSKKYYQTIALGKDAILSDNFDDFVSQCTLSSVDGYYIVLKKPSYFNDDLMYLYKIMNALISIKSSGKEIILGYGNQQDIMFLGAGIDGLASGNYNNVRSFDPELFYESDQDSIKKKGKWYFDGNTLSEYKLPQLDLAFDRGHKDKFGPINKFNELILTSAKPTNIEVQWTEKLSFKNYFTILNDICRLQKDKTLSEKMTQIKTYFETKHKNVKELASAGVRIGDKGFSNEAFEATLGAIDSIMIDRKFDIENMN